MAAGSYSTLSVKPASANWNTSNELFKRAVELSLKLKKLQYEDEQVWTPAAPQEIAPRNVEKQ